MINFLVLGIDKFRKEFPHSRSFSNDLVDDNASTGRSRHLELLFGIGGLKLGMLSLVPPDRVWQ